MVKLRVIARVIPEALYNDAQTSTPAGKKFIVIVRDPDESYHIGTLALEIQNQYQRLYKHDLGKIKYIKDSDDNDLDPEQLVLDVFVNEGKAQRDGLDQEATIRIIQDQRQAIRYGSVIPDLTPVHYQPRPHPPIPRFNDVQSSLGKRPRELPAIQETPGHDRSSKRSRLVEMAQTQDSDGMVRSIEQSPELVHDTQDSGTRGDLMIDEPGNLVKAESPTLRRSMRDIEPATIDELEWLPQAPQDFTARRSLSNHHREPLGSRINGIAPGSGDRLSLPSGRHFHPPITPRTDPSKHVPPVRTADVSRREYVLSSPDQPALSISGSRFKKSARRDPYSLPADSDIEDSQMPMPDQPTPIPRLVKKVSRLEAFPGRQADEAEAQESWQPMDLDRTAPIPMEQEKSKSTGRETQDDESGDNADENFQSAKASTVHDDESDEVSSDDVSSDAVSSDEVSSDEVSSDEVSPEEEDSPERKSSGKETSPEKETEPESEESLDVRNPLGEAENDQKMVDAESDAEEDDDDKNDNEKSDSPAVGISRRSTTSGSVAEQKSGNDDKETESAPALETLEDASKAKTALQDAEAESSKTRKNTSKASAQESKAETAKETDATAIEVPVKRGRGRPRKDPQTSTAIKKTPAKPAKDDEVDKVGASVQTRSASRGPMSKTINKIKARRRTSDLDSPGEQLSQSLQESTKNASILEIEQDRPSISGTNRRETSATSATSTPSKDRMGLGITDSPRKNSSTSVDSGGSKGKLPFDAMMEKMKRRSSSVVSPTRPARVNGRESSAEANHGNEQPQSVKSCKRVERKKKSKARRDSIKLQEQSPVTNPQATMQPVPESRPAGPSSRLPALPPGMTLEQYEALVKSGPMTEEERLAQKKKRQEAAKAQNKSQVKTGKRSLKTKANGVPEITVSVEVPTRDLGLDEAVIKENANRKTTPAVIKENANSKTTPAVIKENANSKTTPAVIKENANSKTTPAAANKNRLNVAKSVEGRSTSSPVADFEAVTARLSSLQPSDSGSMPPPPERKGILKKQSSFGSRSSAAGSDANKHEQSAAKAVSSTGKIASPAAKLTIDKPSRPSPAASSQSKATHKPTATKKGSTAPDKATPSFPHLRTSAGQIGDLKRLKAQLQSQRASKNASPAPTSKPPQKRNVLKVFDAESSDDDSSSSDSDSDDAKKMVVKRKLGLPRVDKSIRDPTPDDDSDSD